jgi:Protein of unknown function (DUF1552)
VIAGQVCWLVPSEQSSGPFESRGITFLVGREGSNRTYREIGVPEGHHNLTHHRNNPEMIERVAQINCYPMRTFAAWMEKMKAHQEGDRTLLDNSMIVYRSGIADGNVTPTKTCPP